MVIITLHSDATWISQISEYNILQRQFWNYGHANFTEHLTHEIHHLPQ